MNNRVHENLKAAIKIMRDACDDAERHISAISNDARNDQDATAISRVLHTLAWGQANAATHIENAMMAHEDEMLSTLYDLRQEGADDATGALTP